MLQLIGLLGCVYLTVKGFELWGYRARSISFRIGAVIAWLFAPIFAVALWAPIRDYAVPSLDSPERSGSVSTADPLIDAKGNRRSPEWRQCIDHAESVDQLEKCRSIP